jgi:translation initiation factor 2B subunit (eIF-2B alpha/beta/delta family)
MVVIANRVHRTMDAAHGDVDAVALEAEKTIEHAERADGRAAAHCEDLLRGRRVFTLSRSETVTEALLQAAPAWVGVAESRPGGEGSDVERALRKNGIAVDRFPDAAMAAVIVERDVEVALVGADAVLPSGAVVNKVGTRLLALAARDEDVPMYAVCAEDKIAIDEDLPIERADTGKVPLFEPTPSRLLTAIVTDNGAMRPAAAADVARQLRSYMDWMKAR